MVNNDHLGPMLTVREVARMLHIHSNTVRRWSDQGILKAYRVTRRGDRRFRRVDIVRFLSELNPYEGKGKSTPSGQVGWRRS